MKLNLKEWSWNGRKLNNPLVIIWRVLWYVPIKFFAVLLTICVLCGWGLDEAKTIWNSME